MPKLTVHSDTYPAVKFAGFPDFHVGVQYEVTALQKVNILQQFAGYQPVVRRNLSLTWVDDTPLTAVVVAPATVAAIENPLLPVETVIVDPAIANPESELIEEPEVEVLTELTPDDLDLVQVEVQKILGKTIKEAEPILIGTGGNPDHPRLIRQHYLEEVMTHPQVQQGLKDIATKLLEQI